MNKIIKLVDKERGIMQLTTVDERYYIKENKNKKTGIPEFEFVPSVTWITHFYPKGIQYMQWLAKKGWDEAETIKTEAGDKGTIVHHAVEKLLNEKTLKMEEKIVDRDGVEREMTPDEYAAVMSFATWYAEAKPKILATETVVWGDGFAGTVDLVVEIDGQKWIIDLKTSQSVWPSHEIQVSAYKHAAKSDAKLAILQVGYKRNKAGFKFTDVEDKYELFLATKKVWENETSGDKVLQKDYPLIINI